MDSPLLWLGTVACASSAALGLLPLSVRTRLTGLTVGLMVAPILIAADNWDGDRLADLRDRPSLLLAALGLAVIGLVVLALVFRRWPVLLAPALVAVMPFRIPIDLGGGSSNLLIPLYAVIAGGLLAAIVSTWREGAPADPSPGEIGASRGWLAYIGYALAGIVVLYALQASYADDLTPALQNVCFFLAPFAALYFLIEKATWDAAALRVIVMVLAAEGLLFVLVGGYQYLTGDLFWNDKVISGNEAHTYFRVNSLFWDPNILGRYLVVTMVVMGAVIAYGRERRQMFAAAAVFVALLALLVFSFSQTSTISLFAGLMVLIAARWGFAYGAGASVATMVALAATVVLVAGGGLSSEASSGRAGLIDGGLEIAADHALLGTGSGGFAPEFTERFYEGEGFAAESHTEPVTAVAEQGIVGLAAYLALLVVTFGGLISATGFSLRTCARGTPVAATLLAIYALMFVHSLGYAAFLVDPITWVVLALAASALVKAPPTQRQTA
jgi:putative inorganic carbon (HCO3(-)) transporter